MKEQVSEVGVRKLQIRWSCKFHRKTSVLDSISNKAAGLEVCNSIKKTLQHSCLPVKLAKFLKTHFFTEEFRWLHLTFNSCLHMSSGQKQVWLSPINTRISWKKYLLWKKYMQRPLQIFSCEYCEIFINNYFEKHLWTAASENQDLVTNLPKGGISSWILSSF